MLPDDAVFRYATLSARAAALSMCLKQDIMTKPDGIFVDLAGAMHDAAEKLAAERGLELTNGLYYGNLAQVLCENAISHVDANYADKTPREQADEAVTLLMAIGGLATIAAGNYFRNRSTDASAKPSDDEARAAS